MSDRRSFLRGLVTLPLIGGGVTLIGQPTATAVPITGDLLNGYAEWLRNEQTALYVERDISSEIGIHRSVHSRASSDPAFRFHYPGNGRLDPRSGPAVSRAALVLSTVGCEWRRS
jgi:hypothetical protein